MVDQLTSHVRVQQRIGGVPVFGGEGIVHVTKKGVVSLVTDNFVKKLKVNLQQARITDGQAAAAAINAYGCNRCLTALPKVDLWVLRQGDEDYLVYRLSREDGTDNTAFPVYFIDASSGKTANLVYANESGALNESMSDVFGAMIERYAKGESANTWLIGEEIYTPSTSGDALRYMNNPHQKSNSGFTADDDPDHYSERYTGSADNGGVHINSGISNYVFYLLSQGGTHHLGGSMTGIGADKAAKIWYLALTGYMTSSTNFKGARTATINAANQLYGSSSTEANAVATAWSLCGVN